MTTYNLGGKHPLLPPDDQYWIAPSASVIGDVLMGRDVSVWFGAVVRGDNERIEIGAGTNVQDGAVLHSDPGSPLTIGASCTVGHRAILHGCSIGDNVLIGMGATVLNDARIGANSIVGANALVTQGKAFEPNSLIMGAPAKAVRRLSDEEILSITEGSQEYVENYRRFAVELS